MEDVCILVHRAFVVCFLQAEDGIRYLVRSRGLGDVYKRQVLAPLVADAPWISMGTPEQPVEGLLWRPDRNEPWRIHAEGLGTVRREAPSAGTTASGNWLDGRWRVVFEIPAWPALAGNRQLAVAVWRGTAQELSLIHISEPTRPY